MLLCAKLCAQLLLNIISGNYSVALRKHPGMEHCFGHDAVDYDFNILIESHEVQQLRA